MTPPIIAAAGPLLSRYEAVFCDVWGVMHNGREAYAEAGAALARFRAEGGTVILVSNAPIPASGVERVLEKTRVRRDAWDAIVSSGDIALRHIAEKDYRRMHWVGPSKRDYALYVRLPGPSVPLGGGPIDASTGLKDDRNETVADYKALIEEGVARALPFVCANPDLVVDVGAVQLLCAGSIAAEYERLGGQVFWAGKPHPAAYGYSACPRLRAARERAGARAYPRHRRCRAHRSCGRPRVGGRRPLHRRRHPQGRLAGGWRDRSGQACGAVRCVWHAPCSRGHDASRLVGRTGPARRRGIECLGAREAGIGPHIAQSDVQTRQ